MSGRHNQDRMAVELRHWRVEDAPIQAQAIEESLERVWRLTRAAHEGPPAP